MMIMNKKTNDDEEDSKNDKKTKNNPNKNGAQQNDNGNGWKFSIKSSIIVLFKRGAIEPKFQFLCVTWLSLPISLLGTLLDCRSTKRNIAASALSSSTTGNISFRLILCFLLWTQKVMTLVSCQQQQQQEMGFELEDGSSNNTKINRRKGMNRMTRIGFGSCHKNVKAANPPIWDAIDQQTKDGSVQNTTLDAWLWLGDVVYPLKVKNTRRKLLDYVVVSGPDDVSILQSAFGEMRNNDTIGYRPFLERNPDMVVAGVWDDHDYGGNDMGKYMPDKITRRDLFWDFLGYSSPNPTINNNNERDHQQPTMTTWEYDGMYHRVDLQNGRVRILFLDTRWFRDSHCIPSIAHRITFGNVLACATRWLTSGLKLDQWDWLWGRGNCRNHSMLGESQWKWLENELMDHPNSDDDGDVNNTNQFSPPKLFLIVSSVQVWSTNPTTEGWGQFPAEQERLWNLVERHYDDGASSNASAAAPVIFLSGDVHHGEILGNEGYWEVTSSGMTHHCGQPKLYGRLCQPILETFHAHRYHDTSSKHPDNYYIGFNYGTIEIDWNANMATVQVHNHNGDVVLRVNQPLDDIAPRKPLPPYSSLPQTIDGHLILYARRLLWTAATVMGWWMVASRLLR